MVRIKTTLTPPPMTTPGIRASHLPEGDCERPVMNLNSSTYCSSLNRTRSSFLKMLHRSILNKASYLILSSIYYWACTHLSAYNLRFKTFLFLTGPFLDKNKLMLLPDFAHLFLLWSYAFCRNTPNIEPVLDPPRLACLLQNRNLEFKKNVLQPVSSMLMQWLIITNLLFVDD